jgi:hypothetical protein
MGGPADEKNRPSLASGADVVEQALAEALVRASRDGAHDVVTAIVDERRARRDPSSLHRRAAQTLEEGLQSGQMKRKPAGRNVPRGTERGPVDELRMVKVEREVDRRQRHQGLRRRAQAPCMRRVR